jgi:hypothetical protein
MYWQPIPLGWRDAPAVMSLGAAIGSDDPRLLLLDLWEWAMQHGREHSKGIAPSLIEAAAGWRGQRGILFDGLVTSGWLAVTEETVTIIEWKAHITARHVDKNLSDSMTSEERRKAQSAIRSRAYRARVAQKEARDAASRSVTLRHAPSRSVTRDASRSTVTQTVTQGSHENGIQYKTRQTDSVTQPSRSRHASRTEVEVEVDIDQGSTNLALFEIRKGAGGEGELFSGLPTPVLPEPKKRGRPPKDKSPEADAERQSERADADRWLDAVKKMTGATGDELRWSNSVFMAFRRARKARGIDQLLRAIEGLENDPFSKTAGLGWLISEAGISKGLLKWNKQATTTHPNRLWGDNGQGYDDLSWMEK